MNQLENETPSLAKVIKDAIEARLAEMNVSLPAAIVTYDGKKANVQPLLKRKYTNGDTVMLPIITNVPVVWPQTTDGGLHLPLLPGMTGTLLFSQRSLDTWLVEGGVVSPEDPRKFHLSDAQFIPGLMPYSEDQQHEFLKLILRYKTTKLTMSELASVLTSLQIFLGSDAASEPLVLGNVLKTYLGQLVTSIGALSAEIATLNGLVNALSAAIVADSVTLVALAPATVAAAPAVVAGTAALVAVNAADQATLLAQKAISVDSPATNIISQKVFTERI